MLAKDPATRLRYCSDALADAEFGSKRFFEAIKMTESELKMLQAPSSEVSDFWSPQYVQVIIDSLKDLNDGEISLPDFCTYLDAEVTKLDTFLYKTVSSIGFANALTGVLRSLSAKQAANFQPIADDADEDAVKVAEKTKAICDAKINEQLKNLWSAFVALPEDEKKKLLPHCLTT